MQLNDKALTILTSLVLLLGVGTLVHKGDDLFAPKNATVQIANSDAGLSVKTNTKHITNEPDMEQFPITDSDVPMRKPDVPIVSDFEFVRSEQTSALTTVQDSTGTLNIEPIPLDCSLKLYAKPLRGARVLLEVIAPCHKNKVVTISHAGLRFNEIVSDKGRVTTTIPVLSDPATIEVSFADGVSKSISAPAKDLSSLQRTGVAWIGQADIQLHATESPVATSNNPKVSALNGRSYKQSYLQGGGYITTLGNRSVENGKFIQIYSVEDPADMFVDFEVVLTNPNNQCGTSIPLQTVRYAAELGVQITNKNMSVKGCSAENKNIVLKNMLRNLIVAQIN